MSAAASASAGTRLLGLPTTSASRYAVPMTAARVADGDAPDSSAYPHTAANGASRYRRRRRPNSAAPADTVSASSMPTCKPDMASRWDAPLRLKSSVSASGSPSRIPNKIACPNAACGSGTALASASAISRRMAWSARANGLPPPSETSRTFGNDITERIPRRSK